MTLFKLCTHIFSEYAGLQQLLTHFCENLLPWDTDLAPVYLYELYCSMTQTIFSAPSRFSASQWVDFLLRSVFGHLLVSRFSKFFGAVVLHAGLKELYLWFSLVWILREMKSDRYIIYYLNQIRSFFKMFSVDVSFGILFQKYVFPFLQYLYQRWQCFKLDRLPNIWLSTSGQWTVLLW